MKIKRKPIGGPKETFYPKSRKLQEAKRHFKKGYRPDRSWGFNDTKTNKHRGQRI